ncbi:DUF4303 domain-containing protein [Sporosarcina sp. FSL K6-1522]|uniref:DUF4303 domain-containing protein n=1 Tax=Sporosarcina sp. FSL K6-1522 TaxID=2921554 RepID=UPI00315AE07D
MKQKIKLAVHEAYTAMYETLKDEQIYAVVLVTDSDCGSLYLTMGTEKSLLQIGENYQDDPENFRFLKDEFLHESDTDLIRKMSHELFDRVDHADNALDADEQYAAHIVEIHEAMSDAMYELKQEGIIDENIFALISVTDDEDEERLEITSAKRCNPNHPLLPAFLLNWRQ